MNLRCFLEFDTEGPANGFSNLLLLCNVMEFAGAFIKYWSNRYIQSLVNNKKKIIQILLHKGTPTPYSNVSSLTLQCFIQFNYSNKH